MDDQFWAYFHEIFEALPRQGPGEAASTARALAFLPPLAAGQRVLDIGCGSGAQTLDLLRSTPARVVAVDRHPPFVARLVERAAALGYADRVDARIADMNHLPFADGSFDVLWSEGAIFVTGFERGLRLWRRLLVPGGYAAVTEFCWLQPDPAPELSEMFLDDGADVGDVAARRAAARAAGYRLVADFVLPDRAWSEEYYAPLAAALERFRAAHVGEPAALAVADRCDREIDMYRRHPGAFGYVFFVLQRDDR